MTGKHDQPIIYAFKLLNSAEKNYNTVEREALAMVFSLHKFKHYLLGNKFVFYVVYGFGLSSKQTISFNMYY
jgi:hypothetical protein